MTSPMSLRKPKRRKLLIVRRVMGDSMVPTLVPGTVVLAVHSRKLKVGDVVVVWHEGLDKIKRIADIQFNKVFLRGDNFMHSTDSRDFGWVGAETVIGKIIWPKMARAAALLSASSKAAQEDNQST